MGRRIRVQLHQRDRREVGDIEAGEVDATSHANNDIETGEYDATGHADSASASPRTGEEANGFLIWRSSAEFADDLRVGCEFIGESVGESFLRVSSLCTNIGQNRGQRNQKSKAATGTTRRIHLVPIRRAADQFKQSDDDSSSQDSLPSERGFLSD